MRTPDYYQPPSTRGSALEALIPPLNLPPPARGIVQQQPRKGAAGEPPPPPPKAPPSPPGPVRPPWRTVQPKARKKNALRPLPPPPGTPPSSPEPYRPAWRAVQLSRMKKAREPPSPPLGPERRPPVSLWGPRSPRDPGSGSRGLPSTELEREYLWFITASLSPNPPFRS